MVLPAAEQAAQQSVDSRKTYQPSSMPATLPLDSDTDDPIVHRVLARQSDGNHVAVAAFNSAF